MIAAYLTEDNRPKYDVDVWCYADLNDPRATQGDQLKRYNYPVIQTITSRDITYIHPKD